MRAPDCVDCLAEGVQTWRPITADSGPRTPRCTTHQRARRTRTRTKAHAGNIRRTYEMSLEQYQLLYAYQGGRCWICQKSTGAARKLAVEHEHGLEGCTHPPEKGCPRCWRALCCKRCNRLVAYLDVDALARAIVMLTDPPARHLFGGQIEHVCSDGHQDWGTVEDCLNCGPHGGQT